MKAIILLFLALFLCYCAKPNVTLNWYMRLESTEECEDFGLYAGSNLLLCPVDRAVSNGDSLLVASQGECYFVKMSEYKDGQELIKLACQDTVDFIKIAPWYWPK
ncbi:MAG: hypothetical protein AAGA62_18615 [Bacteroidota bacterium]